MIGIDIIQIERIEKLLEKHENLDRLFTKAEQEYFYGKPSIINGENKRNTKGASAAGMFAAKEAVMKAFGLGLGMGLDAKDIEIFHSETGAPVVVITQKIAKFLEKNNAKTIHISISHDYPFAVAVAEVN